MLLVSASRFRKSGIAVIREYRQAKRSIKCPYKNWVVLAIYEHVITAVLVKIATTWLVVVADIQQVNSKVIPSKINCFVFVINGMEYTLAEIAPKAFYAIGIGVAINVLFSTMVRIGTIFEGTKLPLRKWFIGLYLHHNHKKAISATQLAKDIGLLRHVATSPWRELYPWNFCPGISELSYRHDGCDFYRQRKFHPVLPHRLTFGNEQRAMSCGTYEGSKDGNTVYRWMVWLWLSP